MSAPDGVRLWLGFGINAWVDARTGAALKTKVRDGVEWLEFTDLSGSGWMLRSEEVLGLETSTVATREADRLFSEALEAERKDGQVPGVESW